MKNTVKKQLFKTISNFYTGETSDNRLKHLVQLTKKLEKPHTGPFFGLSSPKPPKMDVVWILSVAKNHMATFGPKASKQEFS